MLKVAATALQTHQPLPFFRPNFSYVVEDKKIWPGRQGKLFESSMGLKGVVTNSSGLFLFRGRVLSQQV
jgi:hypothetical protein